MTHELKCWPVSFEAILSGAKRHEVRRYDRPFRVNERLMLREWLPVPGLYTGREAEVTISCITEPGTWGLPRDLCVMSVVLVEAMDSVSA